jgi:hypothetical protein
VWKICGMLSSMASKANPISRLVMGSS